MPTKSFTGTGFTPADSRKNADDQTDSFLATEKAAGRNIIEDDRLQEGSSQTGNYYYCQLRLTYHYNA